MSSERSTPPQVTPMHEGVNHAEPCVFAMKMREFGANERFDRWCIKHHHWLNEKPATPVIEELVRGR